MSAKDPLLSCWPDGYSRYYSISNILRMTYGQRKVDILDVGGDSQWMSKFLDSVRLDYNLHIVDTREPDFKNANARVTYTRSDFFKVRSADFPADVVTNTDVLEHIPSDLKVPFVNQCIDFAKSMIILSAPQDHPEVTQAEQQINEKYKKYTKKQQYWLKEHFEFGKPDPIIIERAIKARGYPYLIICTNNLENWLISFSLNFINSEILGLKGMDELNRFYNQYVHSVGDFEGLPYRKIFVVFKEKTLYGKFAPTIQDFFKPDAHAKIGFLAEAFTLLTENIENMKLAGQAKDKTIKKLSKELTGTQKRLIKATSELNSIKASPGYRYTQKINRAIKRELF